MRCGFGDEGGRRGDGRRRHPSVKGLAIGPSGWRGTESLGVTQGSAGGSAVGGGLFAGPAAGCVDQEDEEGHLRGRSHHRFVTARPLGPGILRVEIWAVWEARRSTNGFHEGNFMLNKKRRNGWEIDFEVKNIRGGQWIATIIFHNKSFVDLGMNGTTGW